MQTLMSIIGLSILVLIFLGLLVLLIYGTYNVYDYITDRETSKKEYFTRRNKEF